MPIRYAVVTFGCRVNQADSLRVEEALRSGGAVESSSADADVVVVNTCSVTATADQGARQTIRRIARDNPDARIVVTGCYATRDPETVGALPGVVRVIRNHDKDELPGVVSGLWDRNPSTAERFGGGDGPCGAAIHPGLAGRTAFTLRVQTGCEESCTYCIIPETRGHGRSVPVAAIVEDVRRIAAAGYRELTLSGVHLGSYGRDLRPRSSLLELLQALARTEADLTMRISSLEPMDCSRGIVELVAQSGGRFAPHFHLPLQHGCDAVLRRMRRPYAVTEYRSLVELVARILPGVSIGTDVIAGFPGETDEEFAETLNCVTSLPLSHLHVFPYSDRPGTASSCMAGKVPGTVVRERGAKLREAGARLAQRFRASQEGTLRPALVIDDGTVAVTDNYLKLRIAPRFGRNTRITVRIEPDMTGTVVGL